MTLQHLIAQLQAAESQLPNRDVIVEVTIDDYDFDGLATTTRRDLRDISIRLGLRETVIVAEEK